MVGIERAAEIDHAENHHRKQRQDEGELSQRAAACV
jgi:hypothetical protein